MEINFNVDEFWTRIKKLCKDKKITQKELSSKIGYEQRTLEAQIFKKSIPDIEEVLKISSVLDVSLNYLVLGSETQQTSDKSEKIIEEISQVLERYR